jgi:hypothetical protein
LLKFEEAPTVLALDWPHPVSMEEDRRPTTGKRTVADLQASETCSSTQGGSQPLPEGPSKRIQSWAEWPEEWKAEWLSFKANPDPASRRSQYNSWPPKLKSQGPHGRLREAPTGDAHVDWRLGRNCPSKCSGEQNGSTGSSQQFWTV